MLYTNLNHIETSSDRTKIILEEKNLMICCGRMGFGSISVYTIMEKLESKYPHVKFYDIEFDNPESFQWCKTNECFDPEKLPYIFYYKNGEQQQITSGIQTQEQIVNILNKIFGRK